MAEKLAHAIKGEPFICPSCGEEIDVVTMVRKDARYSFKWTGIIYMEIAKVESDLFKEIGDLVGFFHHVGDRPCIFRSKELEKILLLED